MSAPSIVNALVAWASGDADRIAKIKSDRDAIAEAILNGAKSTLVLTSGSQNGKSFTALASLSLTEKMELFHNVLSRLGELGTGINDTPAITFAAFDALQR